MRRAVMVTMPGHANYAVYAVVALAIVAVAVVVKKRA